MSDAVEKQATPSMTDTSEAPERKKGEGGKGKGRRKVGREGLPDLMSLIPGACTPMPYPNNAEHQGSLRVIQYLTRSPVQEKRDLDGRGYTWTTTRHEAVPPTPLPSLRPSPRASKTTSAYSAKASLVTGEYQPSCLS